MAQRPRAEYASTAQWAPWAHVLPTWEASGTDPSIGNGTLIGACRRIGTTGFYRGAITMGSGTTFGTGAWQVSLPDGWAAASSIANGYQQGRLMLNDSGTNTYSGVCYVAPSSSTLLLVYGSPWVAVGPTAPFTWTTGDFLSWGIKLELDNS